MGRTSMLLQRFGRVPSSSVPAGIYGTVICASILASAGGQSTTKVAVVVIVTLFVYWLAERYAEVLGLVVSSGPDAAEEAGATSQVSAAHVRHVLRTGWSMIEASITPLVVLLCSRLLGATAVVATNIALGYTVFLLVALGRLAATRAGLDGWPRVTATAFAAALGLIVVGLKAAFH